jgi:Type II secretory pathway, prepilin signal peptidase PulO and related peptidases
MITAFFVFVLGACAGSFCSALLYRTRHGGSVVTGRSQCTSCKKQLKAVDLIPIVSWLVARGRCRYCKARFSWQYLALEVGMGLLFLAAYFRYCGFGYECLMTPSGLWTAARLAIFCVFLVLIFVYDARHGEIPDAFSITGGTVALLINIFMKPGDWMWYLLAAAVGAAFFGAQYVLSRGHWVGDGDILVGAMIGAMVGWPGVIAALMLAYVLGLAVVIALMIVKRKKLDDTIAMGPFLALAAAVVLFVPFNYFPLFWYAW